MELTSTSCSRPALRALRARLHGGPICAASRAAAGRRSATHHRSATYSPITLGSVERRFKSIGIGGVADRAYWRDGRCSACGTACVPAAEYGALGSRHCICEQEKYAQINSDRARASWWWESCTSPSLHSHTRTPNALILSCLAYLVANFLALYRPSTGRRIDSARFVLSLN